MGRPRSSTITRAPRRKKRAPKNLKRIKKTRTGRVALNAALALKETKRHQVNSSTGTQLWNNTNKWMVFQPLNLDMSSTNSEAQRESSMIYALNYRLKMIFEPAPQSTDPFYLRFVTGYAKGSANQYEAQGVQVPNQMVQSANINTKIPNYLTEFDKDDWVIKSDKLIRVHPQQIYDSSSGDTVAENTLGSNDNRALWRNTIRNFNFKFNRKYTYEESTGGTLVGWVPFIAVQLDRTHFGSAFTGETGGSPSPLLTYESCLYFKDIH